MRARGGNALLGLAALAATAALAAREASAKKDPEVELAVIVNRANSTSEISAPDLEAIFTSSKRSWSDGRTIVALNYAPQDPLRVLFDRVALGFEPDEMSRFWVDQKIRGGARPPRVVDTPEVALRVVAKLPGAVAYVPAAAVDRTVKVVARLRDGKVMKP
jgi:hypothetical protein